MTQDRTIRARTRGQAHHVCVATTTVAFALSRGMTMTEIEAVTGLDATALGDPEGRLPDDIPHRLWNALGAAEPGLAIGLEAARSAHFSALGGLMHGAQYAATLRDALAFLVRNRAFLADRLELTLVEGDDETMVVAHHPNDVIDAGRVAEVGSALVTRLVREILGVRMPLRRVELPFPPCGPSGAYRDFFRCEVRFEAPRMALVFPTAVMASPVRTADPTLFAFVERHFEIMLARLAGPDEPPELARLRAAIAEAAAAGDYRARAAAVRARLSLRSAQRLAGAHGLTLQAMITEARRSTAEALLSDPSVPIATVASLLGFSDERSFRRAFKRWTGSAPSNFRRRHGANG